MSPETLRKCFREYAGVETFYKFTFSLRGDFCGRRPPVRLRYWQERIWEKFSAAYPEAPTEIDAIGKSFLWCFVHDRALEKLLGVDISYVKYSAGLATVISRSPFGEGFYDICCPECISAVTAWIASHPDECQMLRRRTTLEKYQSSLTLKSHPKFPKAVKVGKMIIETWASMRETDELWEWENGRGGTGLCIVRDGVMNTSWLAPLEPVEASEGEG